MRACRVDRPWPVWRNWQTRRIQNPFPARECRFDSCHRHSGRTPAARRISRWSSSVVAIGGATPSVRPLRRGACRIRGRRGVGSRMGESGVPRSAPPLRHRAESRGPGGHGRWRHAARSPDAMEIRPGNASAARRSAWRRSSSTPSARRSPRWLLLCAGARGVSVAVSCPRRPLATAFSRGGRSMQTRPGATRRSITSNTTPAPLQRPGAASLIEAVRGRLAWRAAKARFSS